MHAFLAALALLFAAELKNGEIVDGVTCAAEPAISYAYYLPANYTPRQTWPVVFVFDPRKRGARAAEFFREPAEKYGWIVVSSNNTESDTDAQPSIHAIQTMLPDAQQRFSIDTKRIYVAGFSGTAIIAWALADVTKSISGVFGCSGRPLPDPRYNVSFAWFGTAGSVDFNNMETRELDRGLDAAHATHRMELFDGPHRWAPPELIARGFEWFELLAMKNGSRPKDETFIAQQFADQIERAGKEQDLLVAARQYESIVRTFDGLVNVDAARERAKSIKASREFAKAQRAEKHADDLERSYRQRTSQILSEFLQSDAPEVVSGLAHALQVPQLLQLATKPTYEGLAAQRVLEGMHAQLAFYRVPDATGSKLAVMKQVAAMIRPKS